MRYEVLVWTADKVRSAKLAVIISYSISASIIIINKNAHKLWITLPYLDFLDLDFHIVRQFRDKRLQRWAVWAETVLHVWLVASEKTNYIVNLKANQIVGAKDSTGEKSKLKYDSIRVTL